MSKDDVPSASALVTVILEADVPVVALAMPPSSTKVAVAAPAETVGVSLAAETMLTVKFLVLVAPPESVRVMTTDSEVDVVRALIAALL